MEKETISRENRITKIVLITCFYVIIIFQRLRSSGPKRRIKMLRQKKKHSPTMPKQFYITPFQKTLFLDLTFLPN